MSASMHICVYVRISHQEWRVYAEVEKGELRFSFYINNAQIPVKTLHYNWCMYVYVCMHVYIYIYIHTHKYNNKLRMQHGAAIAVRVISSL
jgi:hypothetical protein